MPLKHRQQVDDQSCTSACLAMLLNVPVMDVIGEFHIDWLKGQTDPIKYLTSKEVEFKALTPFTEFQGDGVYLTTVPSLNHEGTLHHILVVFKDSEMKIFDPNQGRPLKRYYVNNFAPKDSELEVHLKHYIYELRVDLPEEPKEELENGN